MKIRIENLRAPQLSREENFLLDIAVEDGKLRLSPLCEVILENLLENVSPKNVHQEVETSVVIGREIW